MTPTSIQGQTRTPSPNAFHEPTKSIAATRGNTALSPAIYQTAIRQVEQAVRNQTLTMGPLTRTRARNPNQLEDTQIVMDYSSSMDEPYQEKITKQQAANEAAIKLVNEKARIDLRDRIGIIAFNMEADVLLRLSPLSSHKDRMIAILQSIRRGGGTDLDAALIAADENFDWQRQDVVRRIILLTDGHGVDPLHTAEDLKRRKVVIDVTGIGPDPSCVDEELLKKVASTIQGETHYRFIRDSRTLVNHYTQLAGKTITY
jgi:Mg-chelatase subunit ChlD